MNMLRTALIMLPLITGLSACESVDEEINLGMRGPAKYNTLLAAERFSAKMGIPGLSMPGLSQLPAYENAVITTSSTLRDRAFPPGQLYAWLNEGGHLILLMTEMPLVLDLEDEEEATPSETGIDEMPEVFRQFGLRFSGSESPEEDTITVADPFDDEVRFTLAVESSNPRLDASRLTQYPGAYIGGTPEAASIVSIPHGDGRITAFADASWITNAELGKHQHADILWSILSLGDWTESTWFVYANHHSLLELVVARFWPLLIAMAITLVIWLWMSGRRSGPIQHPDLYQLREFSRHLQAGGSYLWRSHLRRELVQPAQRRLRARAHQRLADIGNPNEAAIRLLALRGKLPPETVRAALDAEPRDASELIQLTRLLQKLDRSL